MPIKVTITGKDLLKKAGVNLRDLKNSLPDKISKISFNFGLRSLRVSKKDFLSGPRPEKLGVVTGRLRSSIRFDVSQQGNLTTTTLGTDVPYARIHEFGGAVRRRKKNGGSFTVKIPQRAFLRPAVEKSLPELKNELLKHFKGFRIG